MPIYEYRCAACGHYLEALQKMSDAPLRKCPECAKSQLRRLVSAPQFRLKGSGWYETDFKGDGEKKRNLVGDKAEASEPVKSEEKKEAAAVTAGADTPKSADKGADKSASAKPAKKPAKPKPSAKSRAAKSARA